MLLHAVPPPLFVGLWCKRFVCVFACMSVGLLRLLGASLSLEGVGLLHLGVGWGADDVLGVGGRVGLGSHLVGLDGGTVAELVGDVLYTSLTSVGAQDGVESLDTAGAVTLLLVCRAAAQRVGRVAELVGVWLGEGVVLWGWGGLDQDEAGQ